MDYGKYLSDVEEIIEEARNGRMYILVDDEDRENEGDPIVPAQMATPAATNFMAPNGRGRVRLALPPQRADELATAREAYDSLAASIGRIDAGAGLRVEANA